jgi:hypothetical protein
VGTAEITKVCAATESNPSSLCPAQKWRIWRLWTNQRFKFASSISRALATLCAKSHDGRIRTVWIVYVEANHAALTSGLYDDFCLRRWEK